MKKRLLVLTSIMSTVLLLTGCESEEPFVEQHKTETETVSVSNGIIPQEIEKSISYVQKEKDGEWIVENVEISSWQMSENAYIPDTVWIAESDDATSMYSKLNDSFKDKPATLYIHFNNDISDMSDSLGKDEAGTDCLDITLKMSADIIFDCADNIFYFSGADIFGSKMYEDGSAEISMDFGDGKVSVNVPSDVKQGTWDDFYNALPSEEEALQALIARSNNYITNVSFEDIPTFKVTSECLKAGVWDDKITNTSYGDKLSPDLSWDEVEGAAKYAVIMIDSGWLHMDVLTEDTSLAEGAYSRGERWEQYVGPYPPAGTHTYSVFVFALKNEPGDFYLGFDNGANDINKIYQGLDTDIDGNTGNVISFGRLDGNYTHKN
ncbi:MAG: hypothetical protein K6G75_07670 [Lachnospiraceae bacterium]|nr:hypothetical protein [Lachnospiraceae bacterium]